MSVYDGVTHSRLKGINVEADTLYIGGTAITATAAEINAVADSSARLVSAAASTLAVTAANHDGKIVVLNRAAGVTATLPAATGSGSVYRFSVGTAVTSNSDIIKVANATDVMAGALVVTDQADGSAATFGTVAASDTVTLNGGTTGGLIGGLITVIDIASGKFSVTGAVVGNGTEATPFSATVS
jgi:hypothetical protein